MYFRRTCDVTLTRLIQNYSPLQKYTDILVLQDEWLFIFILVFVGTKCVH